VTWTCALTCLCQRICLGEMVPGNVEGKNGRVTATAAFWLRRAVAFGWLCKVRRPQENKKKENRWSFTLCHSRPRSSRCDWQFQKRLQGAPLPPTILPRPPWNWLPHPERVAQRENSRNPSLPQFLRLLCPCEQAQDGNCRAGSVEAQQCRPKLGPPSACTER